MNKPQGKTPARENARLEKLKRHEQAVISGILKKQNELLGGALMQLDSLLLLQKSISLLDVREIRKVLAEKLPHFLAIRFFSLFLYQKGDQTLALACHNRPDFAEDLLVRLDESEIMRDALMQGRYILETDFYKSKYYRGKKNPIFHHDFFISIPLMIENEIIGILNLNDNRKGFFTVADLDFVLNITEFLSLSISNALLFEKVQTISITDGLTRVSNRQHMQVQLEKECARSQRYGSPLAAAIADVDFFKRINDTYGHLKGDEILIEVAATLRRFCRANDMAARYGGEEFVLVLPETHLDGAFHIAERIRQAVEGLTFRAKDKKFGVTISIGVAEFERGRMAAAEQLLKAADLALYAAKESGRNRVLRGGPDGVIGA